MKAILEFILPEDHEEHKIALKGSDYLFNLHGIFEDFRRHIKYGRLVSLKAFFNDEIIEDICKICREDLSPATDTVKQIVLSVIKYLEDATDLVSLDDYRTHLFDNVIDSEIKGDL